MDAGRSQYTEKSDRKAMARYECLSSPGWNLDTEVGGLLKARNRLVMSFLLACLVEKREAYPPLPFQGCGIY